VLRLDLHPGRHGRALLGREQLLQEARHGRLVQRRHGEGAVAAPEQRRRLLGDEHQAIGAAQLQQAEEGVEGAHAVLSVGGTTNRGADCSLPGQRLPAANQGAAPSLEMQLAS